MAEKNPNKLYDGIKSIKDNLENIKSIVEEINSDSKALMNDAAEFGGVISKVFKEQMAKYVIPAVQKIIEPIDPILNGDRVPGSLKDLTIFLDSVPLAMVRQEPTVTELAAPVVPENADIVTPAGAESSNPVDNLPANASYANGTQAEEQPVEEAPVAQNESKASGKGRRLVEKEGKVTPESNVREYYISEYPDDDLGEGINPEISFKDIDDALNAGQNIYVVIGVDDSIVREGVFNGTAEAYGVSYDNIYDRWLHSEHKSFKESNDCDDCVIDYVVVRNSKIGSPLGDVANIEPVNVAEFDTMEEAEERAEALNAAVLPEEKELLGTEYSVVEKKVPMNTTIGSKFNPKKAVK